MFTWGRGARTRAGNQGHDSGEPDHDSPLAPAAHSHSHSHDLPAGVVTGPVVKLVTFILLGLVAIATVFGLIALWPDSQRVAELAAASGSGIQEMDYEQGEVLDVTPGCADEESESPVAGSGDAGQLASARDEEQGARAECITAAIGLRSGPDAGTMVKVSVRGALASAGLQAGDRVELVAYTLPPEAGSGTAGTQPSYQLAKANYGVSGVFRGAPLLILGILFAAVVVWVGRVRGALALAALVVSAGVLLLFVLPALVVGQPGIPVALVGSSAIMFVILYAVHGPNMRTTAALVGTLCGILITAGISVIAVYATRLSGLGDESAGFLSAVATQVDFRGLLTGAIIIAGLGILNDVTITQSSAVWELRSAAPEMPRREIFARAMRIGRDHIASTVYTVFFSYVGAALSVLLLLYLYDRPFLSLLTREDIAVELVRTFCGSIGLVLAVPITTWVATLFTPPGREEVHTPWKAVTPSL